MFSILDFLDGNGNYLLQKGTDPRSRSTAQILRNIERGKNAGLAHFKIHCVIH